MVKEIRYTSIRRVLDNLHDHPMLSDLTLEQAVRYVVRFIELNGFPKFFQDKIECVDIHEFRGLLPCDLISIDQVREPKTHICLRSMTDNFTPGMREEKKKKELPLHNQEGEYPPFGPHPAGPHFEELTFKTQGRVIFTSFPEGQVEIAYKAIPVDDDGFPMLIDNETYLAALEGYIKKQVFTVKYDQGKIAAGVLENAKQDYSFLAGQLNSEFMIPSVSEMQSITNAITSLIPRMSEFYHGFKHLGDREILLKH